MTNANLLRSKMALMNLTQKDCAEKIGISESHFCQKLNGRYEFKQDEIAKLCALLNIEAAEIKSIFFME